MGKMLEEISFALDQRFAVVVSNVAVVVNIVAVVIIVVIVVVIIVVVDVDLMTQGMMGMAI